MSDRASSNRSDYALTFFAVARHKRITNKVQLAATDRIVSNHNAASILATSSRTRIDATLISARLVLRAVGADHTFGPTRWRCPNVARRTAADGVLVVDHALAVRAARRRLARVDRND